MKFENNKIVYEHVYWDQASVLVQIGLLNNEGIPISGIEQAKRLLELAKKEVDNDRETSLSDVSLN
jgi:carboxymethylenebutenolidase